MKTQAEAATYAAQQLIKMVAEVGLEPTKDTGFKPVRYANFHCLPSLGGGCGTRTHKSPASKAGRCANFHKPTPQNYGAEGGSRTLTLFSASPSSWCVYHSTIPAFILTP